MTLFKIFKILTSEIVKKSLMSIYFNYYKFASENFVDQWPRY